MRGRDAADRQERDPSAASMVAAGLAPLSLILVLVVWLLPAPLRAQQACVAPAEIVSLQGEVEVRRTRDAGWQPARLFDAVCQGGAVRTGPLGRAEVALPNDSVMRLDENTSLGLRETEPPERSWLDLIRGAAYFFSHRPRALAIDTPFANAGAEGTEFLIRVAADRTEILVYDGRVVARNAAGELGLASGDAARISDGAAPEPMVVARPRDAVAWAIYYPPILTAIADPGGAGALPRELGDATAAVAAQDYPRALESLDAVPDAERDASWFVYRAGILLNVGRVEPARRAIDQALARDPDNGLALAQRAVIRVAQNDVAGGLADAERASELAPASAPVAIAHSYALQANARLEEAEDVLEATRDRAPEDALLLARLAEIRLSLGELDAALEAADAATRLAPDLARTQSVLGFANLVLINIDAAKDAFTSAIELESHSPLPRLGLGLARIRESDLEAGRRELEIAAGLDPASGLIRSYLGKAFYEERRNPRAADQYEMAKRLDPNDPTPWLYSAIQKQTENRPVEALKDLETSIALNDNRAVYRSRLLLDEDLASRGISLARIYDDLGFDQVAVTEATRSLAVDPANHSAHRFLSDAYADLPRHEIAQVSELLQAQLLQPINLNPIQPGLSFTDLNVIEGAGPASSGFNEFSSLFVRNRPQLTLTGLVGDGEGNRNTFAGEGILSGVWNRFSGSLGASGYQTDGFRPNNDLDNRLFDAFGQVAVTNKLNLQAEYRHRNSDQGDLSLNFDPDDFSLGTTRTLKEDIGRVGLRYSPAVHSDLLLSGFYVERNETNVVTDQLPGASIGGPTDDQGYQVEGQYLFSSAWFDLQAGAARYDVERDQLIEADFGFGAPFVVVDQTFDITQDKGYAYFNTHLPADVTWTFGAAYDAYSERDFERNLVSPKFGVQWNATSWLTLRAAAFQTVKPAITVQQTLEPTQIAGFNQFYDDLNGSRARSYGAGFDLRATETLYGGFEYRRRDVSEPVLDGNTGLTTTGDRTEDLFRAYLYYAPRPRWDGTLEVRYEIFDQEDTAFQDIPTDLDQIEVPVAVRYFHPNGLFGQVGGTYLYQDVKRLADSPAAQGTESTFLLDAAIGFRLPGRHGILSLEGRNLLDQRFNYQDLDFLTSEVRAPRYVPARVILGRATLTF